MSRKSTNPFKDKVALAALKAQKQERDRKEQELQQRIAEIDALLEKATGDTKEALKGYIHGLHARYASDVRGSKMSPSVAWARERMQEEGAQEEHTPAQFGFEAAWLSIPVEDLIAGINAYFTTTSK